MPKFNMKWEITPQTLISLTNLCTLACAVIYGYATLGADVRSAKEENKRLQQEVADLRAATTSKGEATLDLVRSVQSGFGSRLVTLEVDVRYIKEGIARIESRQTGRVN